MKKKTKARKLNKKLIILAILLLILSSPIFLSLYFWDRFYPNVYVAGINLSGKTKSEAINLIQPKINIPKNITLKYSDKTYVLQTNSLNVTADYDKTLKNALLLGRSVNLTKINFPIELNLNDDYLTNFIDNVAKNIDIPSQNAKFEVINNKVQAFQEDFNGLEVDKNKLKNEIIDAIHSGDITIDIPTQTIFPSIKTSDVNNLGIKELIGTGTSHFAGSIGSRIYNINLAAKRINNILIAPDQIFSFDGIVGDISALNGYQQAYVIDNGKTVLGDGGGVFQVSTTMFRAAMNSGLPIVEIHAHAYRVHYYEEDTDPGFDATIYSPTVDFKFKNDTGNYILIQTNIDLNSLVLTFNLYGTKDGRTVEITKPVLWGYAPAPTPLYTDDPTLPLGQLKQIHLAATGIKSQFEYTVTKNGEVINHQPFFSNFVRWQAKFLRGTKV